MAAVVDVCNMALGHLGARMLITSIDPPDGTAEAGYCATFYSIARKEAMEAAAWRWTKRRILLAPAPSNPSTVWSYAYTLPSDCLTALRVLQASFFFDFTAGSLNCATPLTIDQLALFTERGSANFDVEDDVLLTNEPDAVLMYAIDVVDTSRWSAAFTAFVSYLLASYLAGPVLKGLPGAQTAGELRKIASQVRGEAAVHSANQSADTASHVASHLAAR